MTTDRTPGGAVAPSRRWLPAGVAQPEWLPTVVLAASAGTALFAMAAARGPHQNAGRLLIPLLACACVVLLRRWPLPVLGVVTAAGGLVTAAGDGSLSFGALLGLALYLCVLDKPRRRSIPVAMTVATVLCVTLAYSAFVNRQAPVAAESAQLLMPLAGAWFIGDSVTARRRYLAGLAAQAERERAAEVREQAAEVREERVRIAREMHDVVAHALAVITVQAGVGRRLAGRNPQQATSALESIEVIGRSAQDELRVVLGLLRDEEAGNAPLAPTPRLIDVKDLADTVRASGLAVDLRMDGIGRELSRSLELSVYRVVQEALTNVVKHAPGARVAAGLTVSAEKVRLDIRDDGGPRGGDAQRAGSGTGHGITGMRERIGAFGGWLAAGPADGGFLVTAEVPIEGAAS